MTINKYYNIAKTKLFPITRSLTGNGVKKTLNIIQKEFPKLKIKKFKSGTKVFDWNIPEEWNVTDAYVIDKYNNRIIDFKKNNLHLVGYSVPIKKNISKKELLKNLYFLKNQPKAIPYITSYYKRRWGFCISYNEYKNLDKRYSLNDKFKVVINSNLNKKGNLNYGELILKGKSKKEILISTYICHPSMANNELSGPIVSMGLINYFKNKKLNKTLRFVFIPETIGSISYLSKNLKYLKENVIGGYNLSCIGDERQHSCMFSKYQNSPSDEAVIEAYKLLKIKNYKVYPFLKRGSIELMKKLNKPFDYNHAISITKHANKINLKTQACFITGTPPERDIDRALTLNFMKKLVKSGIDEIAVFIYSPIPGSFFADKIKGFKHYSQLTRSPTWREDYKLIRSFRYKMYTYFFIFKLIYFPKKCLKEIYRIITMNFETKMEMSIFKYLKLRYLKYRNILASANN